MTKLIDCSCGSGMNYSDCCEPFHLGNSYPKSALELMRSRYTAYVLTNVNYIIETTSPKYRKYYDAKSIESWAKSSKWLGLEIVSYSENRVKFIATFLDEKKRLTHHKEDSTFEQIANRWYFVDGDSFD